MRRRITSRKRALFVVLLPLVALPACGITQIEDVREKQDKYLHRRVIVRGVVQNPALNLDVQWESLATQEVHSKRENGFWLDDGTGTLLIFTPGDLPSEGKQTTVIGHVDGEHTVNGMRVDLVLQEEQRGLPLTFADWPSVWIGNIVVLVAFLSYFLWRFRRRAQRKSLP